MTAQQSQNPVKKGDNSHLTGPRLTAKHRKIMHNMIHKGQSLWDAAIEVNLSFEAAQRLNDKPLFWDTYAQEVEKLRENGSAVAYATIHRLQTQDVGAGVKLNAAKWVAGVDGVAPVTKLEAKHQHHVKFEGFRYERPSMKDVTPGDSTSPEQIAQPTDKPSQK